MRHPEPISQASQSQFEAAHKIAAHLPKIKDRAVKREQIKRLLGVMLSALRGW